MPDASQSRRLPRKIIRKLRPAAEKTDLFPEGLIRSTGTSAVLFLLGSHCSGRMEPCIIFNKRSRRVKQPGDLCFPGGGLSRRLDTCLAALLRLPFSPLTRWPHWPAWRKNRPGQARRLSILFATSLRESSEEMRLWPLGVRLLGPLPAHQLVIFDRAIYPLVGWVTRQHHFHPNWEVESVVRIPISELLDPARYACFRFRMLRHDGPNGDIPVRDFPCYRHIAPQGTELLWGATYRITMSFLRRIYGFEPPGIEGLPVVYRSVDESYVRPAKR